VQEEERKGESVDERKHQGTKTWRRVGVSEEEVAAAGLVVVVVQKAREQDDGIRRTFERHKNMGVTFTSGDESNMKARGSGGTLHSSMCG
jgi:hypothetical protein